MVFTHFSDKEAALLKKWTAAGKSQAEVARLLGRSAGTINRQLKKKRTTAKPVGRPRQLTEKVIDRLVEKEWELALANQNKMLRALKGNLSQACAYCTV